MAGAQVEDPRACELQKIVNSKALESAPTLRRLFEYLGNKALAGEGDSLKEYSVGVDAFSKPSSYDPRSDASVRVQVSKLREKLLAYYETEGRDDPLIVDIPKGHYKLEFRLRNQPGDSAWTASAEVQIKSWRRRTFILGACLAASLLLVAALAVRGSGAVALPQAWSADLEAIWRPFLSGNRRIMLSLGTPMFLRFHDGYFRNTHLNDPAQLAGAARRQLVPDYIREPFSVSFDYTGIGEAIGAVHVSQLLASRGASVVLQPSNAVSWEDVGDSDLIFIGAPKFNIQLLDIPIKQDFVFEGRSIRNLRPHPGEPAVFVDSDVENYGLVSRLPGLHGKGSIMVLAGNSTEATRAVAEYLSDTRYAALLARQLRGSSRDLPKYFQAVIWGRFKSQVPVEIRYAAHHGLTAE